MGMVVRTNTMAINSYNSLGKNNSTVAKNLEKLSSGFKINRAADDASGLAISEKMKAQIKALDTASANAQDGVSLIQTAEGYMGEVHDMLNRIVELAEKSANGTYETVAKGAASEIFGGAGKTEVDRQALQDEVNQLTAEIDRIAETANFNQLKLMNGTMDAGNATAVRITNIADTTVAADTGVVTKGAVTTSNTGGTAGAALTLQIGETSGASDKLSVNIRSFKTDALFADLATVTSTDGKHNIVEHNTTSKSAYGVTINISNQDAASVAAEKVRDTINTVSSQRASLGAMQNRLEYTMNNLNTASENISNANSRIRDTDM
ncbi:MAG: flagellin, partial [Oscillospiraceae bacterium]